MYSVQDTLAGGFPHSEISGSKSVRDSPKLIAAYHVLHRLSVPRHPPNALISLNHSHYRCPSDALRHQTVIDREKTSFFEICPIAAVYFCESVRQIPCGTSDKPSLHDVIKNTRRPQGSARNRYADASLRPDAVTSKLRCEGLKPPGAWRAKRSLVEPDGIEPTTSCLQSTRSPN